MIGGRVPIGWQLGAYGLRGNGVRVDGVAMRSVCKGWRLVDMVAS